MEKKMKAKYLEKIIYWFKDLPPNDRVELFLLVGDIYCSHCGVSQPECLCWDDDLKKT